MLKLRRLLYINWIIFEPEIKAVLITRQTEGKMPRRWWSEGKRSQCIFFSCGTHIILVIHNEVFLSLLFLFTTASVLDRLVCQLMPLLHSLVMSSDFMWFSHSLFALDAHFVALRLSFTAWVTNVLPHSLQTATRQLINEFKQREEQEEEVTEKMTEKEYMSQDRQEGRRTTGRMTS